MTASRCGAVALLAILWGVIGSPGARAATAAAAIEVTPHVGLVDRQTVHVSVSGFIPGGKVWFSECAGAADVNAYGCGEQLAAQPFLIASDDGDATGTFVVSATASARPYSTARLLPCTACVLVAVEGVFAGHAPMPVASTGLSFAALPMTGLPFAAAYMTGSAALIIGLLLVMSRRLWRRGRSARTRVDVCRPAWVHHRSC